MLLSSCGSAVRVRRLGRRWRNTPTLLLAYSRALWLAKRESKGIEARNPGAVRATQQA